MKSPAEFAHPVLPPHRPLARLLFLVLIAAATLPAAAEDKLPPAPAGLYREPLRPQFHVTARQWKEQRPNVGRGDDGWINDPNGLVYYDGEYHLFAQRWGRCWLHAVSKDLLHWTELPPAITEDEQFGWCASGSAVVDHFNTAGLQTGKEKVLAAFYTGWNSRVQCMAYSTDRGRTWKKWEQNPVLKHPDRDPKVFWYAPEKKWIMVLYTPAGYEFFSSPNLTQWQKLPGSIPGMFECPDMFALPLDGDAKRMKWVVLNGDGQYLVGTFDGTRFRAETKLAPGDYGGHLYATQTWNDMPPSDGRRIQIGWNRAGTYSGLPFNQQLSFPCELTLRWLDGGPRLCRWPVREIEKIYDRQSAFDDLELKPGDDPLGKIEGELFDIAAEIDMAKTTCEKIVFTVRGSTVQYLVKEQAIESCGSRVALPPRSGRVQLRILVDRLSVETFGNGGEVSISKFAQAKDSGPPLSLRTVGGNARVVSLQVRRLKSAWGE